MSYHTEHACPHEGCHAIVCLLPELEERLRRTHESFDCPAGHGMSFKGKTPDQKRIAQLEASLIRWQSDWRAIVDRLHDAQSRLRVCPLCGIQLRSRASLVRHLRDGSEGGHGAHEVDLELAETIASGNRRAWPWPE